MNKPCCVLLLSIALSSIWQQTSGLGAECEADIVSSGSSTSPDICGVNSDCNGRCSCLPGYFSPSGNHTDCIDKDLADARCRRHGIECVYCGPTFQGPCQKCIEVIYNSQCLDICPSGTSLSVINLDSVDLVVRQCTGTSTQGLPSWAIVVIAVGGGVILVMAAVFIAAVACSFIRRSSIGQLDIADRSAESEKTRQHTVMSNEEAEGTDTRGEMEQYFETDDDDYEISDEDRDEFFEKFALLQARANVFLKMLNDMRRRLKELSPSSPATQQYKNVMRDLTRLLYLLNKKPENIRIPPDGLQLLNWSDQILQRYLTAQRTHEAPEVTRNNSSQRVSVIGDETGISNEETGRNTRQSSPYRMSSIGDQDETDF